MVAGLHAGFGADEASGATPCIGWAVSVWSGTQNDSSTESSNTTTMPAGNLAVSVAHAGRANWSLLAGQPAALIQLPVTIYWDLNFKFSCVQIQENSHSASHLPGGSDGGDHAVIHDTLKQE